MIFVKVHKSYRDVVAICDSDLIGKKFEEDNFQLDVKESFFRGEEISEESLKKIIEDYSREDSTFNIIGEKSINVALKTEIINNEGIKKIQGIPFALVLM
jgi:hypothetical protein